MFPRAKARSAVFISKYVNQFGKQTITDAGNLKLEQKIFENIED